MTMLVLCPSRGRPDKARELFDTFSMTRVQHSTVLQFVLDDDDPALGEYPAGSYIIPRGRPGMTDALNRVAVQEARRYDIIGFVGDDHRFRTKGWDRSFAEFLQSAGGGFAYGNDLYQGENLPTAVFITSRIVTSLGYFCPPAQQHLYLDDAWKYLGDGAECLFYFPDIIIEHMHPGVGKAEWDEGYARVNAPALYESDRLAFEQWQRDAGQADVGKVRTALAAIADAS